jgi:type I restriction enzyme R subunit
MPAHAYTEDQLVEQPAIGLFAELGWTPLSALARLIPALPPEAITAPVDELTRDLLLPRLLLGEVALRERTGLS